MDTLRSVPNATTREPEDGGQEEKKARKARRNTNSVRNTDGVRYFLAAQSSGADAASVVLGEEFPNEDEVLVASFQKGVAFYRVETWKTRAEKKGRQMVLRKQS
jgi:hypothetical protein